MSFSCFSLSLAWSQSLSGDFNIVKNILNTNYIMKNMLNYLMGTKATQIYNNTEKKVFINLKKSRRHPCISLISLEWGGCTDWQVGYAIEVGSVCSLSKKGVGRWWYKNSSVVNTSHRFKSSLTDSSFNQWAAYKDPCFDLSANGSEWNSRLGGATTSVPSCAICELLNRRRRWLGVHPTQVGTDGGVRASYQSCLFN